MQVVVLAAGDGPEGGLVGRRTARHVVGAVPDDARRVIEAIVARVVLELVFLVATLRDV